MQSFKNILMYPCSYCWTLQKQSILIADKLVINKSEIITATFSKSHLFINKVQSHVYLAGQSKQTKERHQRKERLSQLLWVAASALQFGACSVFPSNNALTDAGGSFSECDENAAEVGCESPHTEPDFALELQRKIGLLETELADCQENLSEAEKENAVLLEDQFSIDKLKMTMLLFYFISDFQVMRIN